MAPTNSSTKSRRDASIDSATMVGMITIQRKIVLFALIGVLSVADGAQAQSDSGALEIDARITPTGARPEPVRQFTFYVLTKSYSEIVREIEEKDPIPPRKQFIDGLKVSPELPAGLNDPDTNDLPHPTLSHLRTPPHT